MFGFFLHFSNPARNSGPVLASRVLSLSMEHRADLRRQANEVEVRVTLQRDPHVVDEVTPVACVQWSNELSNWYDVSLQKRL